MNNIIVSAPGKLHLLGEHAVVYGKPAILAAVNKRCYIEITPGKDNNIKIISKKNSVSSVQTEKEILEKTAQARKSWEKFSKTNDLSILKKITEKPLDYAAIAIGETLTYYKQKLPTGCTISINSEIISHCGMGSSASLAVAIAGAVSLFLDKPLDKDIINHIAFLTEQKKHGFPSGGDNTASCYGGLVWYRKETSNFNVMQPIPFILPDNVANNFITIFTGIPVESTGEMVSNVRAMVMSKHTEMYGIFDDQETLTRDLLSEMNMGNSKKIIEIIREGEKNLEKIGVVSVYVKNIIRNIEHIGGAAKISGGGGKERGTGIVLCYTTEKIALQKLLEKDNIDFSEIKLGDEGVKVEKIS